MRDWCAILIDAGVRGLSTKALSAALGCGAGQVTNAARRWGVRLDRAPLDHARNNAKRAATLRARRLLWWRRELALAEAGNETLTAFCVRTRKGATTAYKWAAKLGHTFRASDARSKRHAHQQAAQ